MCSSVCLLCVSQLNTLSALPDKQQISDYTKMVECNGLTKLLPSQDVVKGLIACGVLGLISGTAWSCYGDCIDDVSPSTQYMVGTMMIEVPLKFLLQRLAVSPTSHLNSAVYTASSYLSYYMGRL